MDVESKQKELRSLQHDKGCLEQQLINLVRAGQSHVTNTDGLTPSLQISLISCSTLTVKDALNHPGFFRLNMGARCVYVCVCMRM